ALSVAGLYIGVQLVESYALTPFLQQEMVSVPPALTLTMQVLMGVVAGMLGVFLAVPLTAAGMTIVKLLYIEDYLQHRLDAA
ncbi:MAG TPA: AI-2E family transporter, partial [Methylophilaceae bacterium]|nr:AI-2E family transporter [Methylophilaceae bacterium]